MDEDGHTLSGLREATGVEARTIRAWSRQGIVPRPGAGRYAKYPPGSVGIVLQAKALRAEGRSLEDIKEIVAPDAEPVSATGGAAAYLAGLRRTGAFGKGVPPPVPVLANRPAAVDRPVTLFRYDVGPGVSLVVEGPVDPASLETYGRAAGAARDVISRSPGKGRKP